MITLILAITSLSAFTGCGAPSGNTQKPTGNEISNPLPEINTKGFLKIDLEVGKGEEAEPGDRVTVHYTGKLQATGDKFDSSVDRDEPFTFYLGAGSVIQGWDLGVVGMKVGGKRKLIIPPHLGYGARGSGGRIPPNATLVFEVELLKVQPGLEKIDLKVGPGKEAKRGDRVTVHYTGTLRSNGKKFDSSLDQNKPFTFTLGAGKVIKGWDLGVAGMKVGGKRKLIIPSVLGYGPRGSPPVIPPGADLVFEVELLRAN